MPPEMDPRQVRAAFVSFVCLVLAFSIGILAAANALGY